MAGELEQTRRKARRGGGGARDERGRFDLETHGVHTTDTRARWVTAHPNNITQATQTLTYTCDPPHSLQVFRTRLCCKTTTSQSTCLWGGWLNEGVCVCARAHACSTLGVRAGHHLAARKCERELASRAGAARRASLFRTAQIWEPPQSLQ